MRYCECDGREEIFYGPVFSLISHLEPNGKFQSPLHLFQFCSDAAGPPPLKAYFICVPFIANLESVSGTLSTNRTRKNIQSGKNPIVDVQLPTASFYEVCRVLDSHDEEEVSCLMAMAMDSSLRRKEVGALQ